MRFGEFRVDLDSRELFRDEARVKIQDLPFRVLAALLENPGQVVTREQLRARLWGSDTFVDAEAGLNTAVAKLREALGDNADTPRFIETLPKRGYRFRLPVDLPPEGANGIRSGAAPAGASPAPVERAPSRVRLPIAAGFLLVVALALTFALANRNDRHVTIAVLLFHNETGDARHDSLAQQLTDGTVVALASNPRLDVIGNAAILRTPRIFTDIQKIGEALHAEFVIVGQLQRADDEIVVRTHFIRVSDQKHLWAHQTTGTSQVLDRQVPADVANGVRDAFDRTR